MYEQITKDLVLKTLKKHWWIVQTNVTAIEHARQKKKICVGIFLTLS